MTEKSYHLLDHEAREKQYITLMEELLGTYYERTYSKMQEALKKRKEEWEAGLIKVLKTVREDLQGYISEGKKGRIGYIHFSYLLSGALSEELLIKLDVYDKRYYRDVEEVECYWDCSSFFPDFSAEFREMAEELSKKMIRVQSGEISRLRIGMMVVNYMLLKPILEEMVRGKEVEKQLELFCEEKACILYGAYLDQAEVIYQFKGGQNEILSF